jgi:hypothetical protein
MQAFTPVNIPPTLVSSTPVDADMEREAQILREQVNQILKGDYHA